jgi:hypothetical protein
LEAKHPHTPVVVETDDDLFAEDQHRPQRMIRITPYYAVPDENKDCLRLATRINPYYLSHDVNTFRCVRSVDGGDGRMQWVQVQSESRVPNPRKLAQR